MRRSLSPPLQHVLALGISLAGAALCVRLGTVLPWMIGPMVAMALASMAGLPVRRPAWGLPSGQLVIGCALGLFFTRAVLQQIMELAPYLVVACVFAFVLGGLGGLLLRRLSGCDSRTAFLASLPGGAAEMSNLAAHVGGRADWVAAAHALRIVLVVLTVPPLLVQSGVHGQESWLPAHAGVDYRLLAQAMLPALLGGLLLQRLKVPNAWVIGPLLVTVALTGLGLTGSAMPHWASNVAQLLIGCALGSRFDARFLRAAPRFMASVAVTVLVGIALAALFGLGLAHWSGMSAPTAILATAPGGVTEMSITAKVLHFGVPVVTAFHITRMAVLVLTAGPLFHWHSRHLSMAGK